MASILLLSDKGRILPIGGWLKNEGHIVKCWFKQGGDELLKGSRNPARVTQYSRLLEQYDLILAEASLAGPAQEVQQAGKQALGCNGVTNKLMMDLDYQKKVLEYLVGKREPLMGIQMRLTGWLSAGGFSPLILLSLPSYHLMERNKGPETEGMGSLAVFLQGDSKLAQTLLPFEEFLLKAKYQGPFSATVQVKGDLWSISQIDSQFIPEDVLAGAELLKISLFEFLFDLLEEGQKGKAWDGLGLSITVTAPPWPYLGVPVKAGYIDVPEPARKHFSAADQWLGVLGVATSRGEDVREARRRVYRTISNSVQDPRVQYREDIGIEGDKDLLVLKEWGWL
jgi:hypothetical protein